jgi:DNA end-binding protein Ku
VAIRPVGDALGMATMIFADEILSADSIEEISETREVKTTQRELDIAVQLVESLAAEFEPEKYTDTYREEVLALIDRKAQGEAIAVQPSPEEIQEPAPDLMSALKASLEAVRSREGAPTGGGGVGAGKKAAARKPAARKAPTSKPPPGTGTKAPASKAGSSKAGGSSKAKAKASSSRAAARR